MNNKDIIQHLFLHGTSGRGQSYLFPNTKQVPIQNELFSTITEQNKQRKKFIHQSEKPRP